MSPHHSAKEIITNLKEGQIASLFQKSVKRVRNTFWIKLKNLLNFIYYCKQKAKEEARRRKSKSQFFELMQEARKM